MDGVVYVGRMVRNDASPKLYGNDTYLYALDAATGQEKWFFETPGVTSPPSISGDAVYVGSRDSRDVTTVGYLHVLDIQSGKEKGKFKTGEVPSEPAISDGVVYFGGGDGYLYAVK